MNRKIILAFIAIYSIAAGLGFLLSDDDGKSDPVEAASYILQGKSTEAVVAAVESVDGEITQVYTVINAVAAVLTLEQRDDLLVNAAILAINEDAPVRIKGADTDHPVATSRLTKIAGMPHGAGI